MHWELTCRRCRGAARKARCPAWALRRLPWLPQPGDDWRGAAGWEEVVHRIMPYKRVLFTIGREPLRRGQGRPPGQEWLVRTLTSPAEVNGVRVLVERGPHTVEEELDLFRQWGIDVLVSKNSGGSAVAAKLEAARALGVPVVMLNRPHLPALDREFHDTEEMLAALRELKSAGPL